MAAQRSRVQLHSEVAHAHLCPHLRLTPARLHASEHLCRLLPLPVLYRNDEQAFKRTGTAQRRAEMERRAQERAEAEAQRLREQAATAHREEREAKLNALHDLNLQVSRSGSSSTQHRSAERACCEQSVMQGLASWHCIGSTRPISRGQPESPQACDRVCGSTLNWQCHPPDPLPRACGATVSCSCVLLLCVCCLG